VERSVRPIQRRTLLSSAPASAAKDIRPRLTSRKAHALSTATKSLPRRWAATTYALAAHGAAFKRCCMPSGRYDGSNREHCSR